MKQTALRYGIYGAILLILLITLAFLFGRKLDYGAQEIVGYLSMVLSMFFVFLGMRYYRDRKNNGVLSFGQGLKLGVLIALLPSVLFGLFDVLYAKVLNPRWQQDYTSYYLENMRKTMSTAAFEIKKKEFMSEMEMFSNPFFQFLIMGGTVFIIGFIISIISALALRRKKAMATA